MCLILDIMDNIRKMTPIEREILWHRIHGIDSGVGGVVTSDHPVGDKGSDSGDSESYTRREIC